MKALTSPVLAESSGHTSAEQTVILVVDYLVTLADGIFQTAPVNYRDSSTNIFNQFSLRQFLSRQRDTFTANTKHIGDKVVRHYQLV